MSHRSIAVFVLLCVAHSAPPCAVAQESAPQETQRIDAAQLGPYRPKHKPDLTQAATLIVEQVNRLRAANKLQPLRVDENLQKAAQYFAEYMARTDTYGHVADDKRPADRATAHGYVDFCIVSENIAYQFRTTGLPTKSLAETFATGWEKSPTHRRNMLDPDVLDTGVAIALSAKTGVFYGVQMFGRMESDAIEFSVANRTQSNVRYLVGNQNFELQPGFVRTHRLCRAAALSLPDRNGRENAPSQSLKPQSSDTFAIEKSPDGALTLTRATQ